MATSEYEWSLEARRWRNRKDGRFVTERTVTSWRNTARRAMESEVTDLTEKLGSRQITLRFWEQEMRRVTRHAHISDYLLGMGGKNNLTSRDRDIIGAQLEEQYGYIRNMARQMERGEVSQAVAEARARMYPRSGATSYSLGQERAWGITLPGYPGRGVQCMSNCRCSWHIRTRRKKIIATYRVAPGDSCTDCLDRGTMWAELEFEQ